jgi:hypothetical protein
MLRRARSCSSAQVGSAVLAAEIIVLVGQTKLLCTSSLALQLPPGNMFHCLTSAGVRR